jgi:hypothetical protein
MAQRDRSGAGARWSHRRRPDDRLLTMRDMVDAQLESSDGHRLGRVADIEARAAADGSLEVVALLVGPEAQLGALSGRLRGLLHRLLGGRFDHRIDFAEIEEVGPTVKLRQRADVYGLDGMDHWLIDHLLRFIPGSGRDA